MNHEVTVPAEEQSLGALPHEPMTYPHDAPLPRQAPILSPGTRYPTAVSVERTAQTEAQRCRDRALGALLADPDNYDRLHRVSLWLSGYPAEAEELLGQTLVNLTAREGLGEDGQDLLRYALTTLRRTAIDRHRARTARVSEELGLTNEVSEAPKYNRVVEPSGADTVELRIILSDAMSRLSEDHQRIITMVHLDGASTADAAMALGLSLGTAKSRLFYGLRSLKHQLAHLGLTDIGDFKS